MSDHNINTPRAHWFCRWFGHKFRAVIGSHEWAFFGREFEFSHCQRAACSFPNSAWKMTDDAAKSRTREEWAKPV